MEAILWQRLQDVPLGTVLLASVFFLFVLRNWRLLLLLWGIQLVPVSMLLRACLPMPWAWAQMLVGGFVALMLFFSCKNTASPPARTHWVWRLGFLVLLLLPALHFRNRIPAPWRSDILLQMMFVFAFGNILLGDDRLSSGLGLLVAWEGALLVLSRLAVSPMDIGAMYILEMLLGLAISFLVAAERLGPEAVE